MKGRSSSAKAPAKRRMATVIGRRAFAKISAVEGIALTPAMKRRVDEFEREGLSDAQRRRAILDAYRKD